MSIYYLDEKKMFVLETAESTYAFAEIDGGLYSAYWGEKLENPMDIPLPFTSAGKVMGDHPLNIKQYNT